MYLSHSDSYMDLQNPPDLVYQNKEIMVTSSEITAFLELLHQKYSRHIILYKLP